MVGSLTACSSTDVPAFNTDDVGENTLYKMTQAAQYLMLSYSEHFLESSYRLHSMANIHVIGRMETALAVGLYFTVKDYSNPGPHGGLVIEKAKPEKQHYAFVTAPNFLAGKMMLVAYPHINYKLRMSDRESTSDPARRIIETITLEPGEIAQGKPVATPASDYPWQVEKSDGNTVVFSAHDGRAIDVFGEHTNPGTEVSGFLPKHCHANQQWKFENPLAI